MSKSKVDNSARYLKSHEWLRIEGMQAVAGISDHAQDAMGDLVFVELPRVGETIQAGERFGVVESVKAASDVYMPVSGTITEVNSALESAPEQINTDPYGAGWMIKFTVADPGAVQALMDATVYQAQLDAEEN
jgi:glycine cleavage system H protein